MSPSPTCASNLCSYSANSALTWVQGRQTARADTTLTLARPALDALALRQTILPEAVKAGLAKVEGDAAKPEALRPPAIPAAFSFGYFAPQH